MGRHEEASCAHCLAVLYVFEALFHPIKKKHFSGRGATYPVWSDRPAGVQWSLWHDVKGQGVELAVNLEGMADGHDWPIGRVIERERKEPLVPGFATMPSAVDITAWIGRDVWNPAGQGKIRTNDLLSSPIQAVTVDQWSRAIEEARACQNAELNGQGTQELTLKNGKRRICKISPHIQFVSPVWDGQLPSYLERPRIVDAARARLDPLHEFLSRRAAP